MQDPKELYQSYVFNHFKSLVSLSYLLVLEGDIYSQSSGGPFRTFTHRVIFFSALLINARECVCVSVYQCEAWAVLIGPIPGA